MHRDTKVGLALGVLLVGVVGAFFFRNEGKSQVDIPQLADTATVDDEIAGKPVIPYLDEGPNSPVDGNGRIPAIPKPTGDDTPPWELPAATITDGVPGTDVSLEPLPPSGRNGIPASPASRTRGASTSLESAEQFHVVEAGDTLTGIAARYLGSTARYLEIYEANRDQMASPDRLKLGQTLRIPDGRGERPSDGPATRSTRPPETTGSVPAPRPLSEQPVERPAPSGTLPELETIELETIEFPSVGEEQSSDVERVGPRGRFTPVRRTPFVPR
jgi:LysM repeat protein